jgi:hypothetical protein
VTADSAGKAALVLLCSYEAAAVTSRRLPTVSMLCRRCRWVEAALLAVLLAHLHVQAEKPHARAAGPAVPPWRSSPSGLQHARPPRPVRVAARTRTGTVRRLRRVSHRWGVPVAERADKLPDLPSSVAVAVVFRPRPPWAGTFSTVALRRHPP